MSQRAICRCPLCQLERRIISQLGREDSLLWFQELTARTDSLQRFATITELVSYAHSVKGDPDKRRMCDSIYVSLLRALKAGDHADLVHGVLLRMLAPGLHKELRGMMIVSFPGIDRDDLTQQLVTNCFEIMRSPGILRKTSYVSASIIEWTKRDTIRWAIRQYRTAESEETRLVIDDVFVTPRSNLFESNIQFRELLEKGVAGGVVSAKDAELLTAYEIEGMSGEELGEREGLGRKALSHRIIRAIERLQRAFRKSRKADGDLPKGPPQ